MNAGNHVFSTSGTGDFCGLESHVVPEFEDILICLADLMAAGNVGLLDENEMTIIFKTSSDSKDFETFKPSVEKDVRFSVPVNN